MSNTPYVYLFIRNDLSAPQQIVQTAHAVDELNKHCPSGSVVYHMVLFGVEGHDELQGISRWLEEKGVHHHMFFEPDVMQHTSIATRALKGSERNIMRKFKLKK